MLSRNGWSQKDEEDTDFYDNLCRSHSSLQRFMLLIGWLAALTVPAPVQQCVEWNASPYWSFKNIQSLRTIRTRITFNDLQIASSRLKEPLNTNSAMRLTSGVTDGVRRAVCKSVVGAGVTLRVCRKENRIAASSTKTLHIPPPRVTTTRK